MSAGPETGMPRARAAHDGRTNGAAAAPAWAAPVPAPPPRQPRRVRARRYAVRLLALALFAAVAFAGYRLVALPALEPERVGVPQAAAEAPAVPADEPEEAPAARVAPASLRPAAFRLENPAGVLGTAFVGWHGGGRTYLLTAHFAAHGVVADAFGDLLVRRGPDTWRARVVRRDKLTQLAVLRLEQRVGQPLWTVPGRPRLRDGDELVIVMPPKRDLPIVRGRIDVTDGVVTMEAPWNPLLLGAPAVTPDGRLAGVVIGVDPLGAVRIGPVGDACQKIRRCPPSDPDQREQVDRDRPEHSEWLEWTSREAWRIGVELARTLWRPDGTGGRE